MSNYQIQKTGSLKKGDGFIYLSTMKKWALSELIKRDCPFSMFKPDLISELYLYGMAGAYLKDGISMVRITDEGRHVVDQHLKRVAKRPKKARPEEHWDRWSSKTLGWKSQHRGS